MQKNPFSVLVLALFLGSISQARSQITITGSSTLAPLVSEMAKLYEKTNKDTRIDVQSGGSSRGIADVRTGLANIGMVSRDLKDDEKDLDSVIIARDGVCVIVNSKNPIKSLSDEQVVKIYTGQIKNWKDVGGADAPITVVNKAEGRSTLELFLLYFKLKNENIKASVVIGDNEQGIKTVAGNPNSIGYVSVGAAEYSAKNGTSIKSLPVNGIEASVANIEAGKFPLNRNLIVITKGNRTEKVSRIISFFNSKNVVSLIKDLYFVPTTK